MSKLRLPAITAPTAEGQLRQMAAYLRYLAEELNMILEQQETGGAL